MDSSQLAADPALGFKMPGYWVWCGSVLRSGEEFRMFASRWSQAHPMFDGYIRHSEIVLAASKSPAGPYRYVKTILPPPFTPGSAWDGRMAHNPAVLEIDGRCYLYFIGTTGGEEIGARYESIRIGLAHAASPEGSWQVLGQPIVEGVPQLNRKSDVVTNPAPCRVPGGGIYLYFRVNTTAGLRILLATAEHPLGPYRCPGHQPELADFNLEDPFVWHNGDGFEMIAKDMTGKLTGELHAGAHFLSPDGVRWEYFRKAYSRVVATADGRRLHLGCLERPQLLFSKEGVPEYLFAAAADGPGGFRNASTTWNMACTLPKNWHGCRNQPLTEVL